MNCGMNRCVAQMCYFKEVGHNDVTGADKSLMRKNEDLHCDRMDALTLYGSLRRKG